MSPAPDIARRMLSRRPVIPGSAVVVVTGASSGIGEAVALRLADKHHHVVLVARSADTLAEVAKACRVAGAASTLCLPTDVSKDDEVERLFADVEERHGRLDAVVHCAGEVGYGRFEQTDADVFDRVIETNVSGTANVCRGAVRRMREAEGGSLVLVGSLLGHIAVPDMTPYVVSKWAVRALARQLRIENADLPDLHVSHVAPGSVDTPIYDKAVGSDGVARRAPHPVITAEAAAASVVDRLERPNPWLGSTQTAWSNYALIGAFRALPWAYDRLVTPAFRWATTVPERQLEARADG